MWERQNAVSVPQLKDQYSSLICIHNVQYMSAACVIGVDWNIKGFSFSLLTSTVSDRKILEPMGSRIKISGGKKVLTATYTKACKL